MLEASENSFGALSQEWQARQKWTDGHRRKVISRLERDILPYLKDRPVSEITAKEVMMVCRRVEDRGAIESAHRIKTIGQALHFLYLTIGTLNGQRLISTGGYGLSHPKR